jgi:hypothetical protein
LPQDIYLLSVLSALSQQNELNPHILHTLQDLFTKIRAHNFIETVVQPYIHCEFNSLHLHLHKFKYVNLRFSWHSLWAPLFLECEAIQSGGSSLIFRRNIQRVSQARVAVLPKFQWTSTKPHIRILFKYNKILQYRQVKSDFKMPKTLISKHS